MNRPSRPCSACQRFQAPKQGDAGFCDGFETTRRADETNEACALFNERGAWKTRQGEQPVNRDHFARERKPT
jgi:hypothetical protein